MMVNSSPIIPAKNWRQTESCGMKLLPLRLPLLAALLLTAYALPAAGQDAVTAPTLPDAKLTPGDTLDVTLDDIRQSGYSSRVRNVPVSVKREVYASYGIQTWGRGEYEIDHLIPLCIGGSNSKKNLWPESCLTQPWNAKVKNRLERRLLSLVRKGAVDLHTAQQDIARNWIEAYQKYVDPGTALVKGPSTSAAQDAVTTEAKAEQASNDEGMAKDEATDTETGSPTAPAAAATPTASSPTIGSSEVVWVNTKSHVIWKPGGAWYGKTERGEYMSLEEALKAGNHLAHGTGH